MTSGNAQINRVVGIDGGGSKTLYVSLGRDGHVLRQARSRGINPIDNPGWQAIYAEAATPFAPAPGETVAVAAALPAHGEVDAISARQRQAIADVFGDGPQAVLNDVDGAQIGAFAGGPGILILSGTGSMAWARDLNGQSHRVGGWGDIIGDEGSAYWIGRRLLGVVAQSLDGRGAPTGLVEGLFDLLGLDRGHPADGLESWIAHLTHSRSQIAALTPVVTRLAEAGDATALALIDAAAGELARHVTAIGRKVGPLPWSYAGGTFSSDIMRNRVAAAIGRAPLAPRLTPIGGALLHAARLAGWAVDDAWIATLGTTLESALAGATAQTLEE